MTVSAVDAIVSDVMFMAELDWLLSLDPLTGVPGGPVEFCGHPENGDENEKRSVDRDFGKRIRAVMKNLRHATAL